MNTDSEFETLLRQTLTARAGTVSSGPTWNADTPDHEQVASRLQVLGRRRTRWIAPLTAAAAVIMVATGVVALGHSGGGKRAVHLAPAGGSCTTSLPSAWRKAINSGRVDLNTTSAIVQNFPLGSTDRGIVTTALTADGSENLVLIGRSGSPRVLYRQADARQTPLGVIDLDGKFALVGTTAMVADPTQSGGGLIVYENIVVDLELIDMDTGQARQLAHMSADDQRTGNNTIDGAAIQDSRVFWDVRAKNTSHTGRVLEFDIGTGATRTAATGYVSGPQHDVAAVTWHGRTVLAQHLPTAVKKVVQRNDHYQYLNSDGQNFAWVEGTRIVWVHGRTLRSRDQSAFSLPKISGLVGPYVFFSPYDDAGDTLVMDTRTGAVASTGVSPLGGTNVSNGLFTMTLVPKHHGNNDAYMMLLDTTTLPGLHC